MNLKKLRRVLYKEFTKSPLKTGFLVAMCPVALYFVLPLFFSAKDKPKPRAARPIMAVQPTTAGVDVPQLAVAGEVENSWAQLNARMTNDPWMASAELPAEARDPFELPFDESIVEQNQEEDEKNERLVTERELLQVQSIVLTATMVTPRARLATINGKTYREQEFLRLEQASNQSIRLAEVGPRHAILDWQGRSIRLHLQRSQKGRIRIAPVQDGD